MTTALRFDPRFVNEVMQVAAKMTAEQLEWMSDIGLDRELRAKFDRTSIRKLEDICWKMAVAKRAAA